VTSRIETEFDYNIAGSVALTGPKLYFAFATHLLWKEKKVILKFKSLPSQLKYYTVEGW
jgi:hypothetical protein